MRMDATTRVAVTVTFLRMDRAPAEPAPALPIGCQVVRIEACSVPFYRYLYDNVGGAYVWWLRRTMADEDLEALLADPLVSIHVLYRRGEPAGFFELDARGPGPISTSAISGCYPGRSGPGSVTPSCARRSIRYGGKERGG